MLAPHPPGRRFRYNAAVLADSQPFSVTKLMAGLGGALLIASFFLPLVNTSSPAASNALGMNELRRQVESTSEYEAVRPLIEPTVKALESFAASPSLMNLTSVVGMSGELLETAAGLGADEAAEMRKVAGILAWVKRGLWLLPLVGAVQLLLPALSRLRGHAGFLGLVGRFLFGWIFALMALVPIAGAPSNQQSVIGVAIWVLLVGSVLMILASLFGVTRRNWWAVILADAGIVAGTILTLKSLSGR